MAQNYQLQKTGQEIDALLQKIDGLDVATDESSGLMSAQDKSKLDGIESGAEENLIEAIVLGDQSLPPSGSKTVTIPMDDAPAMGSNNPVKSSGVYAEIADIKEVIPTTAAPGNKLTPKSQVDELIATALLNYYLKSETYSKSEVNALIAGIKQFTYQVADSLPTASEDTMFIVYLIPSSNPDTQNVKDEYITVESNGVYSWEQIGSTSIDISGKADKDTDAIEGNLAKFDSNGNPVDAGIAATELNQLGQELGRIIGVRDCLQEISYTISERGKYIDKWGILVSATNDYSYTNDIHLTPGLYYLSIIYEYSKNACIVARHNAGAFSPLKNYDNPNSELKATSCVFYIETEGDYVFSGQIASTTKLYKVYFSQGLTDEIKKLHEGHSSNKERIISLEENCLKTVDVDNQVTPSGTGVPSTKAVADMFTIENNIPYQTPSTHFYIDGNGDLVSFGSACPIIVDVTNIDSVHIVCSSETSWSSYQYAFYSTDDIANIGSATLLKIGDVITGAYDLISDVPNGAKTLIAIGVYNIYPVVTELKLIDLGELLSDNKDNIGKMSVSYDKETDSIYIANKYDSASDLMIKFAPCMFNLLMTFKEVGLSPNTKPYPDNPQRAIQTLLNNVGSDNIGPICVANGTIGGNHSLHDDGITKTAKTDSYKVFVDGEQIDDDYSGFAKNVVIQVRNILYDPLSPVVDNILTTPLIEETVLYKVENGDVSVMVNHKYLSSVSVVYYCGMQSIFSPTYVITPNGEYVDWTAFADVSGFKKEDYPDFDCYIAKNANGNQISWLDPTYGIGGHSLIADTDNIFSAAWGKQYHELVRNQTINANTELNWRGVYSWNKLKSESEYYINYLIRNWSKSYYFMALKQNYSGNIDVDLDNIGKIVEDNTFVVNAKGISVSGGAGDEIVAKII